MTVLDAGLDADPTFPKATFIGEDYESRAGKSVGDLILEEQAPAIPPGLLTPKAEQDISLDEQCRQACGRTAQELLQDITEGERDGRNFLQQHINPGRERAHKAYRNEHFTKSKYNEPRYKTRSKLFKPKTRAAVKKAQAAAANALFASADVVTIEASNNANPQQKASAALKMELLNYRLERTHGSESIPWYLVAMGAHQDAWLDGVCVSKQLWRFQERTKEGQPPKILLDRPDCLNIAPENVIYDPNCEWTRPAQTSPYLIVRFPMALHELQSMMKEQSHGAPAWIEHSEDELLGLTGATPEDVQAIRNARNGGYDKTTAATGRFRLLWVYENFLRIDGEDYCFWTIGNQKLLSLPQLTEEAYPWNRGERPIVVGFGAIETHRAIPMSPAEALQQLQQEANDVTNLRLDQLKQVVNPATKVKRGRQVDLDQIRRRGQDSLIMVTDMDDVDWDRPPDVPASALNEQSLINNDFDELAGTFSGSSVASNRDLNETVGGMRMLSGSANSVTEYDLRVWVETWVEPVLWQLVLLEAYYESDERILMLAGEQAELQRFGITDITEALLMEDVTLRVSAGIGASDPMQKLEKFGMAAKLTGETLGTFIQMGKIDVTPDGAQIIDEIFGAAGWKGASERFFRVTPPEEMQPQEPPVDPVAMAKAENDRLKTELAAQKLELDREKIANDRLAKERDAALKERQFNHTRSKDKAGLQIEVSEHQLDRHERLRRLEMDERGMEHEQLRDERDFHAQDEDRRFTREHTAREFGRRAEVEDRDHDHRQQEFGHKVHTSHADGARKDRDFGHKARTDEREFGRRSHVEDREFGRRSHVEDRDFGRRAQVEDRDFGAGRQDRNEDRNDRRDDAKFQRKHTERSFQHQTTMDKMMARQRPESGKPTGKPAAKTKPKAKAA